MTRTSLTAATILLTSALAGCGGGSKGGSPSTPTGPTAPPPPQNGNPTINSVTVTPGFGVSELTAFSYSASASDPDGDAVTYTWDLAGNPASGPSGSITFVGSGTAEFRLTVTDGRGGSATDSRTAAVGSMTGTWDGSIPGYTAFRFDLKQSGPVVTGTFVEAFFGQGRIDPAQPGRIDARGNVEMRFKLARFTDFTFRGRMDSTGRTITGGVYGSGFNGQAFTMRKR